jgi:hypothetical protein
MKKTGTILASSNACNITPDSIVKNYGWTLSFWYIDDIALQQFYGGMIGIRALTTYPGVISVSVIDSDATYYTLKDMTQYQLECLLVQKID